jgi:hypothetical protein
MVVYKRIHDYSNQSLEDLKSGLVNHARPAVQKSDDMGMTFHFSLWICGLTSMLIMHTASNCGFRSLHLSRPTFLKS